MRKYIDKGSTWTAWRILRFNAAFPFVVWLLVLLDYLFWDGCVPGGLATFYLIMLAVLGVPLWLVIPTIRGFIRYGVKNGMFYLLLLGASLIVNCLVVAGGLYIVDRVQHQ